MLCPNCGYDTDEELGYCPQCGHDFSGAQEDHEGLAWEAPEAFDLSQERPQEHSPLALLAFVLAAAAIAAAAYFLLPPMLGNDAPSQAADTTSAVAKEATPATNAASSQDTVRSVPTESTDAQDAEEERIAQENARAQLRADAEAEGKVVLDGTVQVLTAATLAAQEGPEASEALNPAFADINVALLVLDELLTKDVPTGDGTPAPLTFGHVLLEEGAAPGSALPAWEQYNGMRACVAGNMLVAIPSGIDVTAAPFLEEPRVLYVD